MLFQQQKSSGHFLYVEIPDLNVRKSYKNISCCEQDFELRIDFSVPFMLSTCPGNDVDQRLTSYVHQHLKSYVTSISTGKDHVQLQKDILAVFWDFLGKAWLIRAWVFTQK